MEQKRALELDMVRGIAVIGMVLVHVYLNLCGSDNSVFYGICYVLGTPMAAPVFMVLLGVNMFRAKQVKPQMLAKRGIRLVILAVLFNVIAYALPHVAAGWIFHDPEQLIWAKMGLSVADILQFSSATFLIYALCGALHIGNEAVAGIAVLLQLARQYLLPLPAAADSVGTWAWSFLVGGPDTVCFPVACWLIFPAAGRWYGEQRSRTTNLRRFYRNTVLFSGSAFLAGLATHKIWGSYFGTETLFADALVFSNMPLLGNVIFGSFVFLWIGLWGLVTPYTGRWLRAGLAFLSRHTTWIYMLHVPVIKVFRLLIFRRDTYLGAWETVLFTVLLLLFCSGMVYLKETIQKSKPVES